MEKTGTMNLRALARDFANGVIGPQAYRKARDDLLDGILSGSIKVTPHDFQPPPNVQRAEAEADITAFSGGAASSSPVTPKPAAAMPLPRETTPHSLATHRGILAGIAVIIACLVILVALYPFTRQKTANHDLSDEAQASDPALPAVTPQPVTPGRGEILIKQFLQQNDWTEENMQQFIDQWQELNAGEQDAALSSPARTQLANAIHRKLAAEHAMLDLGDIQKSIERQTVLINFAHQTGISDPRLTLKQSP